MGDHLQVKSWWARLRRKRSHDEPPVDTVSESGVFGVPLNMSIRYANVAISLMNDKGESFTYGYVPIVVAKCGVFLKEWGTEVENIFQIDTSTEHAEQILQLQRSFDSPDRYGKGLDLTGYTVHDAATILIKYLSMLPEPVIPIAFFDILTKTFSDSLDEMSGDSKADAKLSDINSVTAECQRIISELPPLNRQLLLYVLDLVAVFVARSDVNLATSSRLATIFQPVLITRPAMSTRDQMLSQMAMEFMIDNQYQFLIGMSLTGTEKRNIDDAEAVSENETRLPALRRANSAPTVPNQSWPRSSDSNLVDEDGTEQFPSTPLVADDDNNNKNGVEQYPAIPLVVDDNNKDGVEQYPAIPLTVDTTESDSASSNKNSIGWEDLPESAVDQDHPPPVNPILNFANWSIPKFPSVQEYWYDGGSALAPVRAGSLESVPSPILDTTMNEAEKQSSASTTDNAISIDNKEGSMGQSSVSQDFVMPSKTIQTAIDEDATIIPKRDLPIPTQKATDQENTTSSVDTNQSSEMLDLLFKIHLNKDTIFTESEILSVKSSLEVCHPEWRLVPRLYIILRTIDCLEHINAITRSGFSDYELPVNDRGVPSLLSAEDRPLFLSAQKLVLTRSANLEQWGADHHHFGAEEPFPFEFRQRLGAGGFGEVDKVYSLSSGKEYACKRFRRGAFSTRKGLAGLRGIIAEIEILKTLSHKHIVQFVGSYTDKKFLGLIMTPVAESDLMLYLLQASPMQYASIRSFFGCLTAGLEYLHGKMIRHKDIKPGNILVYKGNVLLTDFGLARDFGANDGSTTTGSVVGISSRYAAPEVLLMESRNTKSDIWSLGTVFLEMIVVLKGRNNEWLDDYMLSHGSENRFVRANREGYMELIVELKAMGARSDNILLDWTSLMLQENYARRPTAASLLQKIISPDEGYGAGGTFCGLCCRYNDESSDSESD